MLSDVLNLLELNEEQIGSSLSVTMDQRKQLSSINYYPSVLGVLFDN